MSVWDIMSTPGCVHYTGGIPWVHRGFCTNSMVFLTTFLHINHGIPQCTQDISPVYWTPSSVLMSPHCTHDTPSVSWTSQCTEHPPMYCTDTTQGENISEGKWKRIPTLHNEKIQAGVLLDLSLKPTRSRFVLREDSFFVTGNGYRAFSVC